MNPSLSQSIPLTRVKPLITEDVGQWHLENISCALAAFDGIVSADPQKSLCGRYHHYSHFILWKRDVLLISGRAETHSQVCQSPESLLVSLTPRNTPTRC